MGSEQSQHANAAQGTHGRPNTSNPNRLQRGNTIAVSGRRISSQHDDVATGPMYPDSRPVSPPISVCSDSDLPYVSYTDRPIGDSPKIQNKGSNSARNNRNISVSARKTILTKSKAKSVAHDIVVVREANRKAGADRDPDLQRLQVSQFNPTETRLNSKIEAIEFKLLCNGSLNQLPAMAINYSMPFNAFETIRVGADFAVIYLKAAETHSDATYKCINEIRWCSRGDNQFTAEEVQHA